MISILVSKQAIIAQVIQEMPAEMTLAKGKWIDCMIFRLDAEIILYHEELIKTLTDLRGGSFGCLAALGLIGAMIILLTND